ncbi:MAG: hypothetical protein JWQ87_3678 [Candidatus Sulfotelmatobacter sp.]|nr:hypothetical protein [Candidatus Sulfotelmatobacter sp.]
MGKRRKVVPLLAQGPIDLRLPRSAQCRVDLGKRLAPEESVVRAQRRRVGGFDDDVPGGVEQLFLFMGVAAPQDEDDVVGLFADYFDDLVRERFPAFSLVRVGLMCADGQHRIEQ